MSSIPVPKPAAKAFRFYNTMLFHGYFRTAITVLSIATGAVILFTPQTDWTHYNTYLAIHLIAGFFGVYLVAMHTLGYFLCKTVHHPGMDEPRQQLTDTGWIMVGLVSVSLLTGLSIWLGWFASPGIDRFKRVLHVGSGMCYVILSASHYYYYIRYWKPALKNLGRARPTPIEQSKPA
jgi:hypothetical protein